MPTSPPETIGLDSSVGAYVSQLQRRFLSGSDPAARGTLARLRQAVDEQPGDTPEVWQIVLDVLPEQFLGTRDQPTRGEWAAHVALTLYGVHQQGNQSPMHAPGTSFGTSMGRLMRERPSAKSRYDALLTASHFTGRRNYLRTLVGLLSTDGIPTDHGRLALDLFRLQSAAHKDRVIRVWGRDFYRAFTTRTADHTSA
ncbi:MULTISPECIES: type I-E CRISPR-associated protein Cse2/CasB [Kocuria]|uniref:type I-E CRISPR-associated protein Cse2/CasB n=1 Tax=Kocuria TaxID=57493 RepID=UPI0007EBB0E1|nr:MULTISPECIES: type I-E CRISPR-associated protein Cse2/CasB [Kocuria]MBX7556121.1 type I-E CRISPR-associated protein Cse2/CasB [Streptomyces sp. tea 10]MCT1723186.1 type I-E CRISPR-associated protein Cse2/CasB [Kocuria marina]MCT1735497.1 type I-E CRISPR-associated protein Cse2/CasB [Kocuria marina]OBA50362.1 type I-E CRISPR-associated protein Cse2/CasB [Kocuria sp. ICS0012]